MIYPQDVLFFADRLPPLIGGMEMHARYFIEYFTDHKRFPLSGIVTKNEGGENCLVLKDMLSPLNINNMFGLFNPTFVFFNSGRWIEELKQIRILFPKATFIYRTGGNEILKASLTNKAIHGHILRQNYWVNNLNNFIDILITNSAYTEIRLRKLGINCPFFRCVGGVNTSILESIKLPIQDELPIIFCAARFVPYKNHNLLLSVIKELKSRGHKFRVKLAGDGPLLMQIKKQVQRDKLESVVEFLGAIDNEDVCREIAKTNIYMQLSIDQVVEVPGGSYIHSEGMGRSILEALTAGVFVVAGKSGALSEIVTDGRGILVELNNIVQIADQVEKVLMLPKVKLACLDDFSWKNIFKRYESLFTDII